MFTKIEFYTASSHFAVLRTVGGAPTNPKFASGMNSFIRFREAQPFVELHKKYEERPSLHSTCFRSIELYPI